MHTVVILPIITRFAREIIALSGPEFVDNKYQIQESIKFCLLLHRTTNENDIVITIVTIGNVQQDLANMMTKQNEGK
jgi:hypothetical protein